MWLHQVERGVRPTVECYVFRAIINAANFWKLVRGIIIYVNGN